MADAEQSHSIGVIGAGISGLSCAWLLNQRHNVTLYEAEDRLGGHSCTVTATPAGGEAVPVDMGFIVYNEPTYPNLTALFAHLGVPTQESCMSFAVSLEQGGFEYGGHDLASLLAQKRNLLRPRFWSMLRQLLRLYGMSQAATQNPPEQSLGDWLDQHHFPASFQRDHLLPMAAAIWSCPLGAVRAQPAAAFFRFCDNHGLTRLANRPVWRTVTGGSRAYVSRLRAAFRGQVVANAPIASITRTPIGVQLNSTDGTTRLHDQVVLATHGDVARSLIADPSDTEARILGNFRTLPNRCVLHTDARVMPRRRAAWSSWNFTTTNADPDCPPNVTYWMNRLQSLPGPDLFVTLNPPREPAGILEERHFRHPVFDAATLRAQSEIWDLQGQKGLWFAGAYLGAGFHEDGLQAGLAVAEMLGGLRRPWQVENAAARLYLTDHARAMLPA